MRSERQLTLPLVAVSREPKRRVESPEARIERHLASCLPPGVPPIHLGIERAAWAKKGRARSAIGDLILFDGSPAKIEVFEWAPAAYGHRWLAMVGGAAFYENGRWQREAADG